VKTAFKASGRRPGSGKFAGCADADVAEALYDMTLEGGANEEIGSVQELGWYGLLIDTGVQGVPHAIVNEDSDGFFTYQEFQTEDAARRRWSRIESMYDEYDDADDDTDYY
jgi:hypothetical protein